jgi:glycosyltransferase involved in cell wall biosynthesis
LRPYTLGRKVAFSWLPIPSNVPVSDDRGTVEKLRRRYAPNHEFIIGHFGTFGFQIAPIVEAILVALAGEPAPPMFLLIGKGSESFRAQLIRRDPGLEPLLHATGEMTAAELSYQLQACDLLIQPYPDGVSTRRGTIMAGLSHGRPIVTTRGLLTEPFWEASYALAMAPAKDPKRIVSLVRQLQPNPAERARMGAAARNLYQERFSLCHTVAALHQTAVKSSACAS